MPNDASVASVPAAVNCPPPATRTPQQQRLLAAMGIIDWQRVAQSIGVSPGANAPALPVPAPSPPASDWPNFETACRQCTRCELHTRRQQVVVGTGNQQADCVIIGEAPGAEEDRQGYPFVGRAGQLLTQMLRAIHLRRESVYITNILKCRPPGNRDPKPEEIAACTPHLTQQLTWLAPKVVLLLGRVAAQTLLESTQPMRVLRGQSHSLGPAGYPVIVTYHPAYLLRNPSAKAKALEDLLRVKALLVKG